MTFRKGIGLVGRCISLNRPRQVLEVNYRSTEMQQALRSREDWDEARREITHNLRYEYAQQLAESYSQVLAIVLRDKGEAIGCVTLDLAVDSKVQLPSPRVEKVSHPLYKMLLTTAEAVEAMLTKTED